VSGWSRRRWIGAAALGGTAAALALRPGAAGAPHDATFLAMSRALQEAGLWQPTLVIDRQRLQANARRVRANLDASLALRLVNKSLPCLSLLDEVARLTGTQRQMVFNQPYLLSLAEHRPRSDVLLGKPFPVQAAAQLLRAGTRNGFDFSRQVQWLVDSPARLAQYRDLARGLGVPLRINLEIDVGLHRGGLQGEAALQDALRLFKEEPLLQWAGFMGYDAHTEKIPALGGLREQARAHVLRTYRQHLASVAAAALPRSDAPPTLNAGGSPTYRLHRADGPANEVAVGSALVKPMDFDTPLLADLVPAAWIATPVLKVGPFQAPDGVGALGAALRAWDPNQQVAHFIHGGQWLARPESPAGLQASGLIGVSSNQQLLLGSGRQRLRPDDFVFWRPTQSEAVLQQFGDIAVIEGDRVVAMWPVFPARA
jgi:D-serine deaminase-like pyridoxal phosphate-dependent protein